MSIPAGIIPPLVTPLRPDAGVDIESFDRLIDHVLGHGAVGVLALGSTGENSLLSRDERSEVVDAAVTRCAQRAHVMVGLPAMGLKDAVADAAAYATSGASSILVPAPYGFAHSTGELADYFRAVRSATGDVPIVAYNVPSRTGVVLDVELVGRLAEDGVIVGVKDSSGNLEGHRSVSERTSSIEGFRRLTGSELCIDGAMLGGFDGAIPGLANVSPRLACELHRHACDGDWRAAAATQARLVTLSRLYDVPSRLGSFTGAAIGALKSALVYLEVIAHATVSPPFAQPDEALMSHVVEVLQSLDHAKL